MAGGADRRRAGRAPRPSPSCGPTNRRPGCYSWRGGTAWWSAPGWPTIGGRRRWVRRTARARGAPSSGVGTALLRALAEHCSRLGVPVLRAASTTRVAGVRPAFGFVEVDREIEQVRAARRRAAAGAPPDGVEVVMLAERPAVGGRLRGFGTEVLADFAVFPAGHQRRAVGGVWAGDPMFLALARARWSAAPACSSTGPARAGRELLTAVRRTGVAAGSRPTSSVAPCTGPRPTDPEVYTWTQAGNA